MIYPTLVLRNLTRRNNRTRFYSMCCPPRKPPSQCPQKIVPPVDCRPEPIPPNPCILRHHHGKDTYKKFRNITFFVLFPLIIIQTIHVMGHEPRKKVPCRDYEYMRMRTKRFPWGDGTKSLFHNDRVNYLPGECKTPPLDCD